MIACTSRGLSVYHFQQYQHMDGLLYSTRIAFKIFFFLFCHRLDIFHRWAWKFLESQMHITDIDSKIPKEGEAVHANFHVTLAYAFALPILKISITANRL